MMIVRIHVADDINEETYYEPAMSPELCDMLAILRRAGWKVRSRRVDAEREIGRLKKQAEKLARKRTKLQETSSAWLSCETEAKRLERLIQDVKAAVQGKGSLLDPV